jgi:ABC-2 type transport system permease protein
MEAESAASSRSWVWLARHELRLAFRDGLGMLTAGRRSRERVVAIVFLIFVAVMHLIALAVVTPFAHLAEPADKQTLIAITSAAGLSFSLMLSQALESVTRGFYARADLDLILSSPTNAAAVFCVRIVSMALMISAMGLVMAAPFINVLDIEGGAHWLAAYPLLFAMGAAATAIAIALTIALFRTIGPRRTRLAAQIVAAVIGAAFVIGLQVAAVLYYGTLSRFAVLQSDALAAHLPDTDSLLWWPARAVLGGMAPLASVLVLSALLLAGAITIFSPHFADDAIAAVAVAPDRRREQRRASHFRKMSPRRALRAKEFVLLRRDPWLMSQTLMQMLYLLPPALMLWHSFGEGTGPLILLVPVLVMAAGQLAGGLTWLAISGEDAPELVATAPIAAADIMRAKIEAVTTCIAVVFLPFVAAIALSSAFLPIVASIGIALAASSAAQIQLWFRAQAKRSHFRRRHTSSRIATFAEAFSSIAWAATAALLALGSVFAAFTAAAAIAVLFGARLMRPPET